MHSNTSADRASTGSTGQAIALAVLLSLVWLTLSTLTQPAHAAPTYATLAQEFKTLSADSKKSGLREPWEKLQARFDAFVRANPNSGDAPKAAFMAARCIEEIAVRTRSARDFTMTAVRYGEVGTAWPKTQQGAEALLKKAEIEFAHLQDHAAATKTIDQLLANSLDEAIKKKARELEKKITAAPAATPKTDASVKPTTPPAPPAPIFDEPTLVSVTINASDKEADAIIELSSGAGYSWRFIPKAKTSSGQTALVLEVEGVVPNEGITGMRSVSKGPVRYVSIVRAKVNAADGKSVPSCRVELTLKDDYATTVSHSDSKINIRVNSGKKQTAGTNGRGVAGRIEAVASGSSQQSQNSQTSQSSGNHHTSKAEMLGLTVNTILLDPGHGGKDPGAQANGITESKMVLKIAKMVETRLKKKGFQVSYTRDNDVFIALEKRTETANRRKVDLFVSIHVNANTDASVAGLETYYLDKARTKSAERVAARENGVSVAKIDDLQVILTDLGLGTKMQESLDLAKDVQKNMERQVKAGGYTVRTNGVRSGPFYVLMGAKMPAILVEVGYCTNKNDANYLKSDKYLERIADGIVDGIVAYKKRIESSVE